MTDDPVNHPAHYTSHPSGIECIEITRHMGFNCGNVTKYVWRADLKGNAIEDLEKALWYLEDEIAMRKKKIAANEPFRLEVKRDATFPAPEIKYVIHAGWRIFRGKAARYVPVQIVPVKKELIKFNVYVSDDKKSSPRQKIMNIARFECLMVFEKRPK